MINDISNYDFKDPLELDIFEENDIDQYSNELNEMFGPKDNLNENYNKYFRKRRDAIENLYDEIDEKNKVSDPDIDNILSQL